MVESFISPIEVVIDGFCALYGVSININ